jgi:hypothetical protein
MTITKVLNILKEDRATRKLSTRARRSKTEDENLENSVPKGFKTVHHRVWKYAQINFHSDDINLIVEDLKNLAGAKRCIDFSDLSPQVPSNHAVNSWERFASYKARNIGKLYTSKCPLLTNLNFLYDKVWACNYNY